ncbi:hypothetical protein ACO2I3_04275 [Leptospira interrogans]
MSVRFAAALVAALQLTSVPAATAADLYGGPPGGDPRYSDGYRYDDQRYPPYGKQAYVENDNDEAYDDNKPRYVERYDRGEYLRPMKPPRFNEYTWSGYERPGCVPGGEIRRELIRDGWRDFRDAELRGGAALVTARRPNGEYYRLRVNRCTGEVVRARPLDPHGDSYAWRRRGPYQTY